MSLFSHAVRFREIPRFFRRKLESSATFLIWQINLARYSISRRLGSLRVASNLPDLQLRARARACREYMATALATGQANSYFLYAATRTFVRDGVRN